MPAETALQRDDQPVGTRRGPTFLVIGAARSGTTLLTHELSRHPDVAVTDPKEPHFLAFEGEAPAFRGPGDEATINRRAVTDPAAWLALFDDTAAHSGEGSVSTLYYAERTVPAIERRCATARLIVVLRDPVERAWSAHQYLTGRGYEHERFGAALDAEERRREEGWHHLWHYVAMGRYARQLRPFVEAFGTDQLLALDYDELVDDPARALRRCHEHLGVAPQAVDEVPRINASGAPRSGLLATWAERARSHERTRTLVRAAVPFTWRERLRSANARRTDLPAGERTRLEALFAPERRELIELLGPQAPQWARR